MKRKSLSAYIFSAFSGLRREEMLALRCSRVKNEDGQWCGVLKLWYNYYWEVG